MLTILLLCRIGAKFRSFPKGKIINTIILRMKFDGKRKSGSLSAQISPQIRNKKDWKNYKDQAYSCPRDWRLSASWGGPPESPRTSQDYRNDWVEVGVQLSPHYF